MTYERTFFFALLVLLICMIALCLAPEIVT